MKRKTGKGLVVGAGIAGIRAALDLAESGYGVTLIDRAAHLGGVLAGLDRQFPTNRCGMCKMLPLVNRDASSQYCLRKGLFHENIDLMLSTELVAVEGEPGSFSVTLRREPALVDPARCTGCGECERVCPVEIPDDFNCGLSGRKAIHLPVPHAIPNPFHIDQSACTRCGECEKVCPTGAIDLSAFSRDFGILVVDDELIMRDSLKEWLEAEGYGADTAPSGREALDMLARGDYKLMLVDIKMPGMDGVEVLKRSMELFPDITVIMMTAYATVETAVEAMKIGALNYLVKPFDPEAMIPMVEEVYRNLEAEKGPRLEAGAIVLAGGTASYSPGEMESFLGYGVYPGVVTGTEFERLMSPSGPTGGKLIRPADGKPVRKAAWLQCVGSRNPAKGMDYCSSTCCMFSIKEALLAKEKYGPDFDASIFYMDMRTFGQGFQRYRDNAESVSGVNFVRARVHSVVPDRESGELILSWVGRDGRLVEEGVDMVVLAVGQRPSQNLADLAELFDLALNPHGFISPEPFSPERTARPGVFMAGSFSGPRDIGDSVLLAESAALAASRTIHAAGGGLSMEKKDDSFQRDVSREEPLAGVILCTCGPDTNGLSNLETMKQNLMSDPAVAFVESIERACTGAGWTELEKIARRGSPNRVLVGACLPMSYSRRIRELGGNIGLQPALVEAVDIHTSPGPADPDRMETELKMGLARLKNAEPNPAVYEDISSGVLVIGGGPAGMTAALSVADHGYTAHLIERTETLGGNLKWLHETIDKQAVGPLLADLAEKVERHPLVEIHTQTELVSAHGRAGRFFTTIRSANGPPETIEHGAVVFATGGKEASTDEYGHKSNPAVITQMELERRRAENEAYPGSLESVAMIQCVGSRTEPRNYCSRVCCPTTIKHALWLKAQNPAITVYVLYRDMMTPGFMEPYYTEARALGVIFVPYEINRKPIVSPLEKGANVRVFEPFISSDIQINADLVVLATGVDPEPIAQCAGFYGADLNEDGFFQPAESKWRPVDSLKEGVFGCGVALGPRDLSESVASAEAAAMRALRLVDQGRIATNRKTARVRDAYCTLCERCIEACPYGAREVDPGRNRIVVHAPMCQGCGACASACPSSAAVVDGFTDRGMFDVIDAAMEGAFR